MKQWLDTQMEDLKEEKIQTNKLEKNKRTTMVSWDWEPTEDESNEEIQVSLVNVMTRRPSGGWNFVTSKNKEV